MLLPFKTSTYARNIYIYGVTSFQTIDPAYPQSVKEFAAGHYTIEQIKNAFDNGWITQAEFEETKALIPA